MSAAGASARSSGEPGTPAEVFGTKAERSGRQGGVVVVGAGAAGLAAAAFLRAAGRTVTLIEAGSRSGGRAHTAHPEALGGSAFDHGASWLHAAGRNPLAELARLAGDPLHDADAGRNERLFVEGRPATPAERAAYDAAESRWHEAVRRRLAGHGSIPVDSRPADPSLVDPDLVDPDLADPSLAEAAVAVADDPWTANTETWEATIIAAADPDRLSLRDWHANLLAGANLRVPGGLGALLARRLGPAAGPVELDTPATRIAWGGPGVRVETPRGTIEAESCIVTVSTGVLRAGGIAFDPPLPAEVEQALHALPMGLLSKVALRAARPDRLGLPPDCSVERRLSRRGEPALMLHAWPGGQDHAVGFLGGRVAWDLAARGPADSVAFALDQIGRTLGHRARGAFRAGAVVTRWGSDPLFLGAYAHAVPGGAGGRAVLGRPLAGGRLAFAGEAVRTDGLAGTVGGAILSGREAAARAA